jgi:hypothetical protein
LRVDFNLGVDTGLERRRLSVIALLWRAAVSGWRTVTGCRRRLTGGAEQVWVVQVARRTHAQEGKQPRNPKRTQSTTKLHPEA